jgi:hypothetical protein
LKPQRCEVRWDLPPWPARRAPLALARAGAGGLLKGAACQIFAKYGVAKAEKITRWGAVVALKRMAVLTVR